MHAWRKTFFAVALLAFLTGCSGYRTAVIPGVDDPSPPQDDDAPQLSEGMKAKVYLVSGERFEGEVVRYDAEFLTIGRVGNYGFEETAIPHAEIERVEVETISGATSLAGKVFGGLAIAFAAVLVFVVISCSIEPCGFPGY
jgi:hypothetical protein